MSLDLQQTGLGVWGMLVCGVLERALTGSQEPIIKRSEMSREIGQSLVEIIVVGVCRGNQQTLQFRVPASTQLRAIYSTFGGMNIFQAEGVK